MQTPAAPPSKSPASSAWRQLQIIVGVAFVLATLFTAWTPGQFSSAPPAARTTMTPKKATALPPGSPTLTPRARPLIGIVAGHWKNDSGAVCNDGTKEVDVNLNIASLVQKLVVEQGFDAEMLSEFDTRLSGYQAAVMISIHADSCDYINNQATGFKVAATMASKRPERAARLTACLRNRYALATSLGVHSTSVTPDMTSYHAFDEIDENTTAVIIETGFLNLDRQFLTQKPDLAAQGITAGIMCYLRNESINLPTPTLLPTP